MPTTKAKATDATDVTLTKGAGTTQAAGATPPAAPDGTAETQNGDGTSAASLTGASLAQGTDTQGNALAPGETSLATSALQPSSSASAPVSSGGAKAVTAVHSIVHTIEEVPQDAEAAMARLRQDMAKAQALVSNVGHYAALPFEELGKALAGVMSAVGVLRGKI